MVQALRALFYWPLLIIYRIVYLISDRKNNLWMAPFAYQNIWKKWQRENFSNNYIDAKCCLINYQLLQRLVSQSLDNKILTSRNGRIFNNYLVPQLINPITDDEEILLKEALLDVFPHEVLQVKIHTYQEKTFSSKILHGRYRSIGDLERLNHIIKSILRKIRKKRLSIQEIEIVHVHPSLEVVLTLEEKTMIYLQGLGRGDLMFAGKIAEHLPYPLTIKAITSSRLSYAYTII